jgi:hypothetical protein
MRLAAALRRIHPGAIPEGIAASYDVGSVDKNEGVLPVVIERVRT